MEPESRITRLHSELRADLAAAAMSLRTLALLEREAPDASAEKRLTILRRARTAVEGAAGVARELETARGDRVHVVSRSSSA